MRCLCFGIAVQLAALAPGSCDNTCFMPDGKSVVRCEEGKLLVKNLEDLSESELAPPTGLKLDYSPLSRSKDGLIAVCENEVMSLNAATKEWRTLWKVPEDLSVDSIACDLTSGGVVFVLRPKEGEIFWRYLAPGAKEPKKVFNRRAAHADNPWFDLEGNLFFTCSGDIWKGGIEAGDDEAVPFVLFGDRMWPIARHETSGSNSSGLSAHSVIAFGPKLLVNLGRTGGSGWGNIVRVPNEDPYEKGLPLKWEELEEVPSGAGLALAPDGKSAAIYITSAGHWFLVEKPDGEMIPVPPAKK